MKVNMTPNPLDVVTIHASQGDTEARQWEFELHNNGELIDTSSVTEQLFFKAYKGGTEQILPENTSTPTTSPFLGDIRYPQGLLTNQEFTYRQSPTEEDGLAKITDIKGNTLVWNQLIASNETVNLNRDSARTYNISTNNTRPAVGHKYCFATTITSDNTSGGLNCRFGSDFNAGKGVGRHSTIFTANDTNNASIYCYIQSNEESGTAISFKDSVFFDLTLMFGAGNEPTTVEEFTSLFSLPYYSYNQGTLLSFNGNGIKTVGKNQLKMPSSATLNGLSFNVGTDGQIQITGTATAQTDFYLYGASARYDDMGIISSTYTFSCRKDSATTGLDFFLVSQQLGTRIGVKLNNTSMSQTVALDGSDKYRVFMRVANGTTINTKVALQLELGASVTDFEPYTSSTLSLPISTYFPNGMKNAGDVYDELTETKAITRIGSRAYQSGDESDTSVITDGTTTYYVLATPTETSFTTASLVTENAEIPLSNEDGVLIGKCTDQLSAEPGFHDAKIKLADEDGECYSNKIQLHIERSPQ